MTPPKEPLSRLERILKFCTTTTPRSAPSPPLRRGEVYCLSSFARRAEQWYKEEGGRQLIERCRAGAGQRRRQPSRAAKGGMGPGDYVLDKDEVDALLAPPGKKKSTEQQSPPPGSSKKRKSSAGHGEPNKRRGLPTPPAAEDDDADDDEGEDDVYADDSPHAEARLADFTARLGAAVHAKQQELRARRDQAGHECAVGGGRGWACVDEQYCGHGLVERCVAWVPRAKAHLRARVRFEMEAFFSSSGSHDQNNNSPGRLAELKRARAAALRAETMRRLLDIEARLDGRAAVAEAEMLESPTLGGWPARSDGFPREDVGGLRVEMAGLAFAVDVCLGETRVLML